MLARFFDRFPMLALAFVLAFSPVAAMAQGFTLPDGSTIQGHARITGAVPPTATGCTMDANATDLFGSCTTSSTSGSITFGRTWTTAPKCIIVDTTSAGGAGTVPVYSVSATAITLTTIVSAHILVWFCAGVSSST